MNITHKVRIEDLVSQSAKSQNHARIIIDIFVDDVECGSVLVVSGPKNDVQNLMDGNMTMPELQKIWQPYSKVSSE